MRGTLYKTDRICLFSWGVFLMLVGSLILK